MARELKSVEAVTRQIEALTEIGRQIRECGDLREIKRHKDVMEQLRLLAKRLNAGIDIQNAAWKEAMQSRRAIGRALIDMRENGQRSRSGRKKNESHDGIHLPELKELGFSLNESSRSQALAFIPDELYADAVRRIEESGTELVTARFVEIGRQFIAAKKAAEAAADVAETAVAVAEAAAEEAAVAEAAVVAAAAEAVAAAMAEEVEQDEEEPDEDDDEDED